MIAVTYLEFTGDKLQDLKQFDFWLSLMPLHTQEKIMCYRRWQDALNCLAGNLLLLDFLGGHEAAHKLQYIYYNSYGRPLISHTHAFDFNISHSAEIVVCAISNIGKVGVDIEKVKDICVDDFKSQMLEAEILKIKSSNNQQDAFFEYWTEKEAVIKGNGKGLSLGLDSFLITESHTIVDGDDWHLYPLDIHPAYKCKLASDVKIHKSAITLKKASFFLSCSG